MEEENFGTEEKLKARLNLLFMAWLLKTQQTALLCSYSLMSIRHFLDGTESAGDFSSWVSWYDLPELGETKTVEAMTAKLEEGERNYMQESIDKGEYVPIDLTFLEIPESVRRSVVASLEAVEIAKYLGELVEERLTPEKNLILGIPLPSFSWIAQTNDAISSLFEEVRLRFYSPQYSAALDNAIDRSQKIKLAFYKQLVTRKTKREKITEAINEALDELSKKHGESWRHFRLKKKFDLLWEHPIKGKKTLGKLLEQEGLKKGKNGRQRTVEDMIKNHDLRGEKAGNLP